MKRNKKFVRNCIIIFSILFSIYYFGNFYFSKEKCLEDMMISLYLEDYEVIDELKVGNVIHYVTVNREEKAVSIIDIVEYPFLYRKQEISKDEIVKKFNENYRYDAYGYGYTGFGRTDLFIIYRNDKDIQRVVFENENGDTKIFENWNGDFCIAHHNYPNVENWYLKVYDKDGNFVDYYEDLN